MPDMENGEAASMPNGERAEGEPPSMPNGEKPEKPEDMSGMTPPDNMGGMPNATGSGEQSSTFTIKQGGNQFFNVQPTATTVS